MSKEMKCIKCKSRNIEILIKSPAVLRCRKCKTIWKDEAMKIIDSGV
jgi:ribosomal protein L37AE/L43A